MVEEVNATTQLAGLYTIVATSATPRPSRRHRPLETCALCVRIASMLTVVNGTFARVDLGAR